MSVSLLTTPRRRSVFFSWLPWLIVAGGALAALAIWFWPSDLERANRVVGVTWIVAPLTVILLGSWVFCFSGWSWWTRAGVVTGIPLAVGALALASVREVRLTGDMIPHVAFRWSPAPDEVREAHRRSVGEIEWTPGDLSGNRPGDYPEYRGRRRDGVVRGPALARDWKSTPPRLIWRQPVGDGYAGFAVAGNAAVTIEERRENEAIVCYDAATGKEVWECSYPAYFTETLGGPGPRATPTVADGEVYSLGAEGRLVCLDAATGKKKWMIDVLAGNTENVKWAMSGSPLVYDNVVVVNAGAQTESAKGRALVAYDRTDGTVVWKGSARAGYSSPMLATLGGRRQVLLLDGEGLAGHDAATGEELWRYEWTTHMGINVAQPVVLDGDRVFISSGYNVGGAILKVSQKDGGWSAEPLWQNKAMRCKFTSPVLREGHLYGLDDGVLVCLDAETGKPRWRGQRYGHGQLLLADDLLLILGESGELALVEATPREFRELGSIAALEGKTWNYPALAGGRAFVRNHREMACYDLTGK